MMHSAELLAEYIMEEWQNDWTFENKNWTIRI
jgi:hypothetical protein